jgi:hypothetical protein
MANAYRETVDRLKASLLATAAMELEAEALTSHADQKAELLRAAAKHDEEKQDVVALELRREAESIDLRQPVSAQPQSEQQPALNGHTNQPASSTTSHPRGKK